MHGALDPRIYAIILIGILALALAPLGASALFLTQSGELWSPGAVAAWLQRTQGIYGTAINSNAREVALAIYRLRRPEVAVMSSSRGTEFRQEFFTARFSCACMMMSNIEEGHQVLDALSRVGLPKVMIIGLDYWWFSATDDHTTRPPPDEGREGELNRTSLVLPYEWLGEKKLTLADVAAVMAGQTDLSPFSGEPKLGVQAIKKSFGTRADGSWAVLSHAANVDLHPAVIRINKLITDPQTVLQETAGRYAPDQQLDPARVEFYASLVRKLRERGTQVVAVLLPVAPPLIDAMRASGRYRILDEASAGLSKASAAHGAEFYDFLDARNAGGTTCEFQDPHHGGNALYARILQRIIERNPASALAPVVDAPAVRRIAGTYAGRVVATLGGERPAFREQDFLGIGCRK